MKKKYVLSLLFFLFFVVFSEGLSMRKDQIFCKWAANYLVEKTGSESGEIPEIEPEKDLIDQIMAEEAIACQIHLVHAIAYIRDIPRSRVPIAANIDVSGKLFLTSAETAIAVGAHLSASGYWAEKTDELKMYEQIDTELLNQWCNERREDIVTLSILEDRWNTPEELITHILDYSIDDIPFHKRFFLKTWNIYTKERAQSIYNDYKKHIQEDDLVAASVDVFFLQAIEEGQENVMRDLDTFFELDYHTYEMFLILEVTTISILSAAATVICLILLFFRNQQAST